MEGTFYEKKRSFGNERIADDLAAVRMRRRPGGR